MALGLVQPITGGVADNFLSQTGHVAVGNVDKLLQGCGVTEVSEMEAETFSQHLGREKKRVQWFRKRIMKACVCYKLREDRGGEKNVNVTTQLHKRLIELDSLDAFS